MAPGSPDCQLCGYLGSEPRVARPQRIARDGNQHLSGEAVWLLGEHRASDEGEHHLSNLPAEASLKTLAGGIKARWMCGEAEQKLNEELGLDHFEERSWP